MTKKTGAALLALSISCAAVSLPRTGAAAQTLEGSFASGALPCAETPVVCERQALTLHIGALPEDAPCGELDSYVVSEYTLYNPTGEDIALGMLLPCSFRPSYAAASAPSVTLDGSPLATSLRHTYAGYYSRTVDVESGLEQLLEPEGGLYEAETPVYEHTFTVELQPGELAAYRLRYCTFAVTFDCDPAKTRIVPCGRVVSEIVDGRVQVSFDVAEGTSTFSFAAVGEDVSRIGWGFYADRSRERLPDPATTPVHTQETTSFGEFSMRYRPQTSEISQADWEAGFAQMLKKSTKSGCLVCAPPDAIREESFMQWREYALTVPAHGRIEHAVTSPLWPAAEGDLYEYSYLLSPQSRWAPEKTVIRIETPYYMTYSSLAFDEVGGCLQTERDGLPLGELSFTLSASEQTSSAGGGKSNPISPSLRLAFILLGSLGGVAILCAVAAVLAKRRGRRR